MTSWTYITQSVPWIALGLIAGFFMGRSTVAVDAIADAVQDEGDVVSGTSTKPARRWRFTATHAIGVVVIVLGVFTAVQSYVQGQANQLQSDATERLQACQTAYSNGFADAIDARSEASADAQNALDDLLSSVASITPTPDGRDQFRDALTEYLAKRADAKRAQKEHPYPPAPRDVCKEAG